MLYDHLGRPIARVKAFGFAERPGWEIVLPPRKPQLLLDDAIAETTVAHDDDAAEECQRKKP